MPGFLLALAGLVLFAFCETDDNYWYIHSLWHILIASSILFFLPHKDLYRKGKKIHVTRLTSIATSDMTFPRRKDNHPLGVTERHAINLPLARRRKTGDKPMALPGRMDDACRIGIRAVHDGSVIRWASFAERERERFYMRSGMFALDFPD